MNTIIKAHNNKVNRLVDVSRIRRANELDFFTECSIKYNNYLNSPLALNPNEDKNLQDVIQKAFIEQAQDPLNGVIARSTRLATNVKNMDQRQIKDDKKFIDNYFTRLEKIQKLGGYLIVAVEEIAPDKLPLFISSYDRINVNGTDERTKDRNMIMLAGWANLFDYFEDIKVEKGFNFRPTANGEIAVLTQAVAFDVTGEAFKKYLHQKNYVIDDFLNKQNLFEDEFGRTWYTVYGEVDSTQVDNGDLISLYLSPVPEKMNLEETFENGGITIKSTLQPQYFLGGSIMSSDPNSVDQDTSIKIPQYKIEDNKVTRWFIKPINTSAINRTPAYKVEVESFIAGLFAVASGDISVLSGFSNKRLNIDLPLGMNEVITPELEKMYLSLSPEGKASFVGNRYVFNTVSEESNQKISLIDAQKAYIMQLVLDSNLDIKLIQGDIPGGPSMIKETLDDSTPQGKLLIDALNKNNMPLPDFYKNMLGIKEWQAGIPLYYQKLQEEIRELPTEKTPELEVLIEQYS